jgi:polygalacturonase
MWILMAAAVAISARDLFDVTRECNVTAFGAVGDNITDSTDSFRSAVQHCGTVVIPSGTFRTASFNLTSNQRLQFDKGATLIAQPDSALYPIVLGLPPMGTGRKSKGRPNALISAYFATNVSIIGAGREMSIIDGLGWQWWQNVSWKGHHYSMPSLIETYKCKDVVIEDITLMNSPTWTLHPFGTDGVHIRGLSVLGPRAIGGVSGIHPDSSRNVLIEDCIVDVGDDAIVVASYLDLAGDGKPLPAENILVRNCTALSRNIAIGAGTSGGIRNITFEDCTVGDDTGSSPWAFKIKSQTNNNATIEDITVRRLKLGRIQPNTWQQPKPEAAIDIGLQYGESLHALPILRNLVLEDIVGTSAAVVGRIVGLNASHIQGLVVRNVTFLEYQKGWTACTNTDSPDISAVTPALSCS